MSDHYIAADDLAAASAPAAEHVTHPSPLHVVTTALHSLATADGDLRKRCACALYLIRRSVVPADVHDDARPIFLDLVRAYGVLVDEVSAHPLRLDVNARTFTLPRAETIATMICELHTILVRAQLAAQVVA